MLLRLTAPGVPDLYQGTEYWDFSLVDPDNRRPVDYGAREGSLASGLAPDALMATWRDGRVKQAILHRALALRARSPELFARGAYQKLAVEGPAANHVLAFSRQHGDQTVIVIVSRLSAKLELGGTPLIPADFWQGTSLQMARSLPDLHLINLLGGRDGPAQCAKAGRIEVGHCLAALPVALLEVR